MRLRAVGAAVVLGALVLTGCAPAAKPRLTVTPSSAFFDRPLIIRLTGLAAGEQVSLAMTSQSSDGPAWSSSATFRAQDDGTISTGQAPVAGDYRGARPMGLVEALRPSGSPQQYFTVSTSKPWTMTVTARTAGAAIGATTVTRRICPSVEQSTRFTIAKDGVLGVLTEPLHPAAAPQPAVVVFGGSEGGLSTGTQACLLAAHGYPSLAIAYFHDTGLPSTLEHIPLETFERAVRLLDRQPHVDPARIVLWGTSRGSEAALLTAATFPRLVHAVVASVPNWETAHALPDASETAWQLDGRAIPTGTQIPVEKIAGPILLVCGGEDQVWQSCSNAELIRSRLREEHAGTALTLLEYPHAGHFVGTLLPYYPASATGGRTASGLAVVSGGTALADAEARDDAYPRLLAWLARLREHG